LKTFIAAAPGIDEFVGRQRYTEENLPLPKPPTRFQPVTSNDMNPNSAGGEASSPKKTYYKLTDQLFYHLVI